MYDMEQGCISGGTERYKEGGGRVGWMDGGELSVKKRTDVIRTSRDDANLNMY